MMPRPIGSAGRVESRGAVFAIPLYAVLASLWIVVSHLGFDYLLSFLPTSFPYELIGDLVVAAPVTLAIFLLLRREVTRRVDLQAAQQATERRLAQILDSAADGIIGVDDQDRIFLFNRAAEQIFGFTGGQASGRRIQEFLPDLPVQVWRQAHADRGPEPFCTLARRRDNTRFPAETGFSITEENGRIFATVLVRDVSWHKAAEEELRRSKSELEARVQERTQQLQAEREKLTRILDAVPDGICLIQEDGAVTYANPALISDFGAIAGHRCHEYFFGLRDACTDCPGRTSAKDSVVRREFHSLETGKTYEHTWVPMHPTETGKQHLEILRNVTGQRAAEAERERLMGQVDTQRRLFQSVADNAPVGIAVLDGKELRLKWANSHYRNFLEAKYRDQDVGGLFLEEFIPGAESIGLASVFRNVAVTGQPYFNPEYEYRGFARGITYWQWSLLPLPVPGERTPDLMILASEITEPTLARKRLEELTGEATRHAEELRGAYGELEIRTRDLAALVEVSQKLSSTLESQVLLSLIVDQLRSAFQCDGAAVLIPGADGLATAAHQGALPEEQAPHLQELLAEIVDFRNTLVSRTPEIIDDLSLDERIQKSRSDDPAAGDGLPLGLSRSWMGVPMLVQDRPVGILRLHRREPGYFTARHSELAVGMASHIATALENARLYRTARKVAILEERQRLSRELHDSVSQSIYGITLGAHTALELLERDPARVKEALRYILKLADSTVHEMRFLILELRPEQIEREGLISTLSSLSGAVSLRAKLSLRLDLCGEPDISSEMKEAMYRICHEALWNTVKHAEAKQVLIRLAQSDGCLALEITDDGVGFDSTRSFPGHMGLVTMRERTAATGGTLEIISAPSQGTRITAHLPLPSLRVQPSAQIQTRSFA
jgi:PAS domain S-box-containing protein